jgi:hypothetical protein
LSSLPQVQGRRLFAIVGYAGRRLTPFEDPAVGEMR